MLWGAGRRAQSTEHRAQGAGRRAQGAGLRACSVEKWPGAEPGCPSLVPIIVPRPFLAWSMGLCRGNSVFEAADTGTSLPAETAFRQREMGTRRAEGQTFRLYSAWDNGFGKLDFEN